MTRSAVSVRVEIYAGDELADMLTVRCDAMTAMALQEFRETGSCETHVQEGLQALLPQALPAVRASLGELDRQLREHLCSTYLQKNSIPLETEFRFRLQKS
jgi:hypothetical protein